MGLVEGLKKLHQRHDDPEAQIAAERSRTARRQATAEAQAAKTEAQAQARTFPRIQPLP